MKFSIAMATLVAANAVAAYEVPNDNTIANLAAGYEDVGKKPGSGVRGSVQEFAAMPAACEAAKAAEAKLEKCVNFQAKALNLDIEGELKAFSACAKEAVTKEALTKAVTCIMQDVNGAEACWESLVTDVVACYAKSPTLVLLTAICSKEQGELVQDAEKCVTKVVNAVEKELDSPSSYMAFMSSVEVLGALPFESMALEAFYGADSASEDEDESWDWDEDEDEDGDGDWDDGDDEEYWGM